MKNKPILLLIAAIGFLANFSSLKAQVKIGHTNVEELLIYMPETKTIETELKTYRGKLEEQIKVKDAYAQGKLEEYLKVRNTLSKEADQKQQQELMKLEQEINKSKQEAEYKLLNKQAELLKPVLEKIQKAIDDVAKEGGYTYILNQSNSTGVATLLYKPKEHDITDKVMKKLGITKPQDNGTQK